MMAKPTRPATPVPTMRVMLAREDGIVFNPSTSRNLTYWVDANKKVRAVHEVPRAPYWHRRLRDGSVVSPKDDVPSMAPKKAVEDVPSMAPGKPKK